MKVVVHKLVWWGMHLYKEKKSMCLKVLVILVNYIKNEVAVAAEDDGR